MNLSVRKARMGDIRAIHALLMTSSADGLLLPRSLTDLYGHLRDFFVVEGDGATVGCGALSIIWENMAEVRSLAVAAHARRKGCGRLIVEACIAEARELDIHRLFALTYQLPFFNALGFSIVEKGDARSRWSSMRGLHFFIFHDSTLNLLLVSIICIQCSPLSFPIS